MVDKTHRNRNVVNRDFVAKRIRQARLAVGLTQAQLASALSTPVTKQALSKFETGRAQPSPTVLLALAQSLGVRPSWILSEPATEISWSGYRKHSRLSRGDQASIEALAAIRSEAELRLRNLFDLGPVDPLPEHEASSPEMAEKAANHLRDRWRLGTDPIASLTEVIESRGGIVVPVEGPQRFDGLSGFVSTWLPLLVVNSEVSIDRLRFNLAHELGHLVLKSDAPASEQEKLAHRFAGALLIPSDELRAVLGSRRRSLDVNELALVKRHWGISMQAATHRARDLGIIGASAYKGISIEFQRRGWRKAEPGECPFEERPSLFRSLAFRALAEGLISEAEAARMLETAPPVDATPTPTGRPSYRELARMPRETRRGLLQSARVESEDIAHWDATDAAELRMRSDEP